MSTDDAPLLELRRSRKKFIARTIETFSPVIATAIIGTIIFSSGWGRVAIVVLVVALAFALSFAYHRRARLFVTASRLGSRGWVGTWWIPRADLSRAVLVESLASHHDRTYRELFLFDRADKRVARISGRVWGNKKVTLVAHALALPLSTIDRAVTVKELVATEPGALRSYEQRPWLVVVIVLSVVALVVVTGVALSR